MFEWSRASLRFFFVLLCRSGKLSNKNPMEWFMHSRHIQHLSLVSLVLQSYRDGIGLLFLFLFFLLGTLKVLKTTVMTHTHTHTQTHTNSHPFAQKRLMEEVRV